MTSTTAQTQVRLRRLTLQLRPAAAAAGAADQLLGAARPAPLGDYADLYLRGAFDCLHVFRVRELEKLGVAAAEIARRKKAGGRVVSAIGTPHIMYAGACGADVPGNPNIAPEPNVGFNDGDLSNHPDDGATALGAGDVLLTANSSDDVAAAFASGCYVVGIGFPMTTNRYSPPNYNDHPEHGEHGFEDMCSIFLCVLNPRPRCPSLCASCSCQLPV
jgi:hypothetical protein